MERLRPFLASQNLYSQLTEAQDTAESSSPSVLFETLCREVLEIHQAVLAPTGALATFAGPPLVYPAGGQLPGSQQPPVIDLSAWQSRFSCQEGSSRPVPCLPVEQGASGNALAPAGAEWAVPLWSSRGLDGILFLGEKINRNPFTEEEIESGDLGSPTNHMARTADAESLLSVKQEFSRVTAICL